MKKLFGILSIVLSFSFVSCDADSDLLIDDVAQERVIDSKTQVNQTVVYVSKEARPSYDCLDLLPTDEERVASGTPCVVIHDSDSSTIHHGTSDPEKNCGMVAYRVDGDCDPCMSWNNNDGTSTILHRSCCDRKRD
jgi:hypothetical protein